MFWFIGLLTILLGRTFYAGMRYKTLFYREPKRYGEQGQQLDDDMIAGYILRTIAVAITWPLSLPLIGIFVLGQKFNKKEA
jgi:hypothetical protein